MEFKTRKIRKKPPVHVLKHVKAGLTSAGAAIGRTTPKQRSVGLGIVLALIGVFVVFKVMTFAYEAVKNFDPKSLVFAAGADLKKDENGFTNIMLLGDGGHVRDGADLVDTIMVASIDSKTNSVTLLSIPRDLFVRGEGFHPGRINEVYRNQKAELGDKAYELFQKVGGDITGLRVDYYIRLDFKAFVEVVDAIGGVDVNVTRPIEDPFYPNAEDDGYTLFTMAAGPQHMDGETALKFARSRHTTSDFDRAARQHQLLAAIREKALSADVLTSPSKIKDIYSAISKNMNTNLSTRELITLAAFGQKFDRNRLISKVLHDDPGREGGFLYTPDREQYGGQFVLIPFGDNYDLIHQYANLIFKARDLFFENAEIQLLNASKASGVARNAAYQLNRFGFNILPADNFLGADGKRKFADKTEVRYTDFTVDDKKAVIPKYPATLNALAQFIKVDAVPGNPRPEGALGGPAVTVILGNDFDSSLLP